MSCRVSESNGSRERKVRLVQVSITRVGANNDYASGWEKAFGGAKKASDGGRAEGRNRREACGSVEEEEIGHAGKKEGRPETLEVTSIPVVVSTSLVRSFPVMKIHLRYCAA